MRNHKRLLLIILFIIILSLFTTSLFAQDIGIKIAILPFENLTGMDEYDYLSQSISKSIYASVNQQEGVSVIDNTLSENAAKKVGLNIQTMDKVSTTLRFALEAEINVIIMGGYQIDDDNDQLIVTSYVYSIAQKKTIIELTFDSELGSSMFNLVDEISITTSDELKDRRDEIQIALEEIRKNLQPPEYIKEPEITDISVEGVKVEWETNKETVSTLYIGETEDFTIDSNTPYFEDQSEDAINHYVIMNYNSIDPQKQYYYKSIDEDFFQNSITHEEKKIEEKEVYNTLIEQYENDVNDLYDQLEKAKKDKDFDKALEIYNQIIQYNDLYEEVLEEVGESEEVEQETKYNYKSAAEVMKLLNEAETFVDSKNYESALGKYEQAHIKITEDGLEDLIEPSEVEKEINRMKAAIKVTGLIEKGDAEYDKENMEAAKKAYDESLKIIKNEKIDDLIDPDPIKKKLNSINGELMPSMSYINAGIGAFINPSIGITDITDFPPLWQASYNIRFSRFLSMGFGVNLFSVVVDAKLSFVNTLSNELLLGIGVHGSFIPGLPTGFGAITDLRYIHRFGNLGIYAGIGAWITFYFEYEPFYYPYLSFGIVFNL